MKRRRALTRRFGEVLQEARVEAGLSQEKLAFRSGVHPTYVSQIERGLKSPSLEVMGAIAGALRRPLYELIKTTEAHLQ
jgi:transcriptional regulator with XRE-family HTH domain